MAQQLAQVAQLGRGDVGLGQQAGAQQVRERLRVDGVGLHARGGDRPRAQRVREMHVVAGLLQELCQPLPAVGRLERDVRAPRLAEQLHKRVAVVDHPPREQQLAVVVDRRDLRAATVQVDADPTITVGHDRSSSRIVRPRGRTPRGLNACSSGRRADLLHPGRTRPGPPEPRALHDIKRWLRAPLQRPDGTLVERDEGTPQGSAISPVLANLFLHYAFDTWMAREFPGCPFERFADDIVVHCKSRRQAEYVRAAIATRMGEVGLRIHPDKTRIVYCKDGRRRGDHEHTSFTFLGFTFRARGARSKNGRNFTGFLPAISPETLKATGHWRSAEMRIHRRTDLTLNDLAGRGGEPDRRRAEDARYLMAGFTVLVLLFSPAACQASA